MEQRFANTINRFAGWHSITADPRELLAVRRAGEASLREFPYYLARFGERGKLFAGSDGAWLITLCGEQPEVVLREVLWLARVLASRGMPSLLLERHLEVLYGEVARIVLRRAETCAPLLAAAAHLRDRRREHISELEADLLSRDFLGRADPEAGRRLPEMGRLLAAAVADEAAGIDKAVRSLEEWATDPDRFTPEWISAVRATVAAARRLCAARKQPADPRG